MEQFLLLHVLRTVGVEVHFGLLVVQTGEVTYVIAFFYDAQALLGERYGIAEVVQTDFVLYIIVVFGGDVGYQVFDGDAGVGLALSFQFFELLVVGSDVETIEDDPAQVDTGINGLVEHAVLFGGFACGTQLGFGIVQCPPVAGREVERGQVAGIGKGGVVFADLLLVAGYAQGVVVQQSLFQTRFQGIDGCRLRLSGKRGAQND